MKIIELTQDLVTLVDDEDFDKLNQYNWYARGTIAGDFYACRSTPARLSVNGKQGKEHMHRVIMSVNDPEIFVDHIHHDTLDNRKENLRLVDSRGNNSNKKGKKEGEFSSIFTGVNWHVKNKKWRATISKNGRWQYLGSFDSEIEARDAYLTELKGVKRII